MEVTVTEKTARELLEKKARDRGLVPGTYTIGKFHDAEGDDLLRLNGPGDLVIREYYDSTEKEKPLPSAA